ncbi:DUF4878 domain-containing protein [Prevotella sp. PCHR]|uniref:DUF4878 domain-containing protein n=1 Tax=Xylanibacter caecicola TaxID=2736294 RepID=A0ABX2B4J5_9BACT|nr:DUF4878 domain-containing protein [Xylanibacter caecicola]NPE25155.1 DUF4878 domain-containing protein [Xylanibacter caecicola]
MKNLTVFITMFIAAFIMCGCSDNSPQGVAEKGLSCMQKEDWEGYVKLMYFEKKEGKDIEREKEQVAALLKAKGGETLDKKSGIKSYGIISEEISEDGATATVKASIKYGNGDEDKDHKIKLIKDDRGDWKISSGK